MRNSKTTNYILVCLLLFAGNLSCGIMNKQKSESSSEMISYLKSEHNSTEVNQRHFSEWHKAWIQGTEFGTAYIESDSAIVYQPGLGFQLNSGSIFLAKVKHMESIYEDSIVANHSQSNEMVQNTEFLQNNQYERKMSEKDRRPSGWIYQIVIISLVIILIWSVYRRR